MSIFEGIAGALGGNSGSRVINSIIERLTRKKENLNPYRVKGKGDPGYTAPAEVDATKGANVNSRLAMTNHMLATGRRFESLGNLNTRTPNKTNINSLFPQKKYTNSLNIEPSADISSELTNVPPEPSSLVQPFSQPAQQSANQVFGDLFARQNAVGAPMMFKINK